MIRKFPRICNKNIGWINNSDDFSSDYTNESIKPHGQKWTEKNRITTNSAENYQKREAAWSLAQMQSIAWNVYKLAVTDFQDNWAEQTVKENFLSPELFYSHLRMYDTRTTQLLHIT